MQKIERDVAKDYLFSLLQYQYATPFIFPGMELNPDTEEDYLKVVKQPMSLWIINVKLCKNMYESVSQFKNDLDLIWQNCQLYYKPNHKIYYFSEKFKQHNERCFLIIMKHIQDAKKAAEEGNKENMPTSNPSQQNKDSLLKKRERTEVQDENKKKEDECFKKPKKTRKCSENSPQVLANAQASKATEKEANSVFKVNRSKLQELNISEKM